MYHEKKIIILYTYTYITFISLIIDLPTIMIIFIVRQIMNTSNNVT